MASGVAPAATYGSFAGGDQLGLDRGAFGISVAEARSLDPQQRLVLCVGYGALHRSRMSAGGIKLRDALTNDAVGVFVGVEASGLAAGAGGASVFSTSGGALSITSGRLSYTLGLVGPCYSIATACASALAALHVCASAVGVGGECDEGVGMGTKVLSEGSNFATAAGGMTSPHGRCHTFDRRADGYCRGEGCGAFLVSSRAERDGWGRASSVCVLASAVQQDGPSASLTAPNGSSQRRLIETVRRAIIPADDGVPVLEAHGTGTALGDPIEVTRVRCPNAGSEPSPSDHAAGWQVGAADRAFSLHARQAAPGGGAPSQGRGPVQCASLKSNLGHLEAAAAAAGLASLAVGTLATSIVTVNAQLRGPVFAAERRALLETSASTFRGRPPAG